MKNSKLIILNSIVLTLSIVLAIFVFFVPGYDNEYTVLEVMLELFDNGGAALIFAIPELLLLIFVVVMIVLSILGILNGAGVLNLKKIHKYNLMLSVFDVVFAIMHVAFIYSDTEELSIVTLMILALTILITVFSSKVAKSIDKTAATTEEESK